MSNETPKIDCLPTSAYRIGQSVVICEFSSESAVIAELTEKHIGYYFGQERNTVRYIRSVAPEWVKPVEKTYSSLTDEQLIELHRLININTFLTPFLFRIIRNEDDSLIQVFQGREGESCWTQFQVATGDYWVNSAPDVNRPSNMWKVVMKCMEWGVSY
jgi:hypothetical protein